MPPLHIDLPFTHNTLTFSFACLGRHCPIRIHQTCRLSHADFDLFFFASSQASQLRFFHSWDLFVSSSFSSRLSLHSFLSSQVLPLRQQADRFWMSHPVCLIPSALSVSLCWCLSIASLSLKGQRREWHLSAWTLSLILSPFCFLLPPLTWDKVTFTEGHYISLGAPALFGKRTLNRAMEGKGV